MVILTFYKVKKHFLRKNLIYCLDFLLKKSVG